MRNLDALLILKASIGEFRDLSDNNDIGTNNVYLCKQKGVYRYILRGNGSLVATPHTNDLYKNNNMTVIVNGNFFSSSVGSSILTIGTGISIIHEKPINSLFSTFAIKTGTGNSQTTSTAITKTDQNDWYSFVITDAGTITIYRNNFIIASGTNYSEILPADMKNASLFNGFSGIIDELSVYSGAADDETIAAIINATSLNYSIPAVYLIPEEANLYIEREMLKNTLSPSAVPSIFDDFDYNDISSGACGYDAVISNTRIHTTQMVSVTPTDNVFSVDFAGLYDISPISCNSLELCSPYALQDDIAYLYPTYIHLKRGDVAGKIKYSPKLDSNSETIEELNLVFTGGHYIHTFTEEAYLEKPVQIACIDRYGRPVTFSKFAGDGIKINHTVLDRTNNCVVSDSTSVLFFTEESTVPEMISDISYINFFTDQLPATISIEVVYYNGIQGILKVIPKTTDDINIIYPCNIYLDGQLIYESVECSDNLTYTFTKQAEFTIDNITTEDLNAGTDLSTPVILYRTTVSGINIGLKVFNTPTTTGIWPDYNYGIMYPVPFNLSAVVYNTGVDSVSEEMPATDITIMPEIEHIIANLQFYSDKYSLPVKFISI